jgi:predicted nucleic acid-binding protein
VARHARQVKHSFSEHSGAAKFAEKPSSIFNSTRYSKDDGKQPMKNLPIEGVPRVVLDTNVVLDWLVFRNVVVQALAADIENGRLQWMACAAMRGELARTLRYDTLARWAPDPERALDVFDAHAQLWPEPVTLPLLRCSDPDDQVFLDLAVGAGARWLLTHDRALLRLRQRALRFGVAIIQPRLWPSP